MDDLREDPQDPIDAALAKIRAGGSTTPPSDSIDAALAKIRQGATPKGISVPAQRGDATTALPRNRRDTTGDLEAAGPAILGNLANIGGGGLPIVGPVLEGAQAGFRSIFRGQSFRDALGDIRGQTDAIPGPVKAMESAAGGMLIPGASALSPAKFGALAGAAPAVLDPNPDRGIGSRVAGGTLGAAVGGLVGSLADKSQVGLRALAAPNATDNILSRQAERAASAKQLYSAALAEGRANGVTPEVQAYLQEPEIAARVKALQQLDQFKNVPAESPEMLDALYKSLSDEGKMIGKGLAQPDPSKPNTGRFREQNVQSLKSRLLGATEAPGVSQVGPFVGQNTGMMPSYRDAVADFAKRSADIDAVGKGMTALQGADNPRPTFKNITSKQPKTPQTFSEFVNGAQPSEVAAAKEGVLGDLRNAMGQKQGLTGAPFRKTAGNAADLLRRADPNDLGSLFARLGLSGLNGLRPE